MGEKTIFDFFQSKKLNYSIILLVFFLFMGFYLRFYHVDYPVIGYHNWKSAHYLTEARNFADEGFFKAGFFVPLRDTMNQINEQPNGAHADTFPLDPIIIGFLFFNERPDFLTLLGASIVIMTGIYTVLRERYLARRSRAKMFNN